MTDWKYRKGLHDLGNGTWAWLQPDGSWGWSNAGLITDGDASLLVDTLFDQDLTADMLKAMHDATGRSGDNIDVLVNTHANGDHTFGNSLLKNAEIIASSECAREMKTAGPDQLLEFMQAVPSLPQPLADYMVHCFGAFNFAGIDYVLPTRTFDDELKLSVGDKAVELIRVGPAHTAGDTLVHVPTDKVVYTGDILFIEGTPIIWEGPISNWIAALDRILAMDIETVVPGHGPITDKAGVTRVRDYMVYLDQQTRQRFDARMSVQEAVDDIALGAFGQWSEAERIFANVYTLYREYSKGQAPELGIVEVFGGMADYFYKHIAPHPHRH